MEKVQKKKTEDYECLEWIHVTRHGEHMRALVHSVQ